MWPRTVLAFSLAIIHTSTQLDSNGIETAPRECCPCPATSDPGMALAPGPLAPGTEAPGTVAPGPCTSLSSLDNCPCLPGDADSEGYASVFFPNSVRALGNVVRPKPKEDAKPLLHPEVGLASSVLETLREATDEEYRDALKRDAARAADPDMDTVNLADVTPEETRNVVTIIVSPHDMDGGDDTMSQASHVQEARCIHPPLGNARPSSYYQPQVSRNGLDDILNLPLPSGLIHKHRDSNLAASNVHESVIKVDNRLNKILSNLRLKSGPSLLNVAPINNAENTNNILNNVVNADSMGFDRRLSVNPVKESTSNDLDSQCLNSKDALDLSKPNSDSEPFPSNTQSQLGEVTEQEESSSENAAILPKLSTPNYYHLKNLHKLKDVEVIPLDIRKIIRRSKFNIPDFKFEPFPNKARETTLDHNALPKLFDLFSKPSKISHINNEATNGRSTNVENTKKNVQVIPKKKIFSTEILDALPSPSESTNFVSSKDNCFNVQSPEAERVMKEDKKLLDSTSAESVESDPEVVSQVKNENDINIVNPDYDNDSTESISNEEIEISESDSMKKNEIVNDNIGNQGLNPGSNNKMISFQEGISDAFSSVDLSGTDLTVGEINYKDLQNLSDSILQESEKKLTCKENGIETTQKLESGGESNEGNVDSEEINESEIDKVLKMDEAGKSTNVCKGEVVEEDVNASSSNKAPSIEGTQVLVSSTTDKASCDHDSEPLPSKLVTKSILRPNSKSLIDHLSEFESRLGQNTIVQPTPLINTGDLNIFKMPALNIPDISDLTSSIPTLEEIRTRVSEILGGLARHTADEEVSSELDSEDFASNINPVLSTVACTSGSTLSPLQPLKDINLNIIQLKPQRMISEEDPLKAEPPGLNLNTYKAKLAIPNSLKINPLNLVSTLGNDGGLVGATLSIGPAKKDPVSLSHFPTLADITSSVQNNARHLLNDIHKNKKGNSYNLLSSGRNAMKSLQDSVPIRNVVDNLKAQTENTMRHLNLIKSPAAITGRDSLGDILQTTAAIDLKPHAEKAVKDLRKTLKATLRNSEIKPLTDPKQVLQIISNHKEDLDDKLFAIRTDLSDRLESVHNNIKDPEILKTILYPDSNRYFESFYIPLPSYSMTIQNANKPKQPVLKTMQPSLGTQRKEFWKSTASKASKSTGTSKLSTMRTSKERNSPKLLKLESGGSAPTLARSDRPFLPKISSKPKLLKPLDSTLLKNPLFPQSGLQVVKTPLQKYKPLTDNKNKLTFGSTTFKPNSASPATKQTTESAKSKVSNNNRFKPKPLVRQQTPWSAWAGPRTYPKVTKIGDTQTSPSIANPKLQTPLRSTSATPINKSINIAPLSHLSSLSSRLQPRPLFKQQPKLKIEPTLQGRASNPEIKLISGSDKLNSSLLSKLTGAFKSRQSKANSSSSPDKSSSRLAMAPAASQRVDKVVPREEPLKENVHYKCKMICVNTD